MATARQLKATEPSPFRIRVEPNVLDDLQLRLKRARWPAALDKKDGWAHGSRSSYLRDVVDHWRTGYDWGREEAQLNTLPQFTVPVDDARLHFVHAPSKRLAATPLLLLHGWPDSFNRFHKVIPKLTDAGFDVVVPSLPGFPFTGPLLGLGAAEHPTRHSADLVWKLMTQVLGYSRFAVAGGDGGSAIAQLLAIHHRESVIGIHLTDIGWHPYNVDKTTLSHEELKFLEDVTKRMMADGAYAMVQMTRPRSLAVELNDSPIGLAAWILDRFHAWSAGDLDKRFGRDALLTNIMLYWVTQTIGSSIFTYCADARSPSLTPKDRVELPVALALFPHDVAGIPPRTFAERTLNVQRWTQMPRGGHFAALEEPQLYAADVTAFFRSMSAGAANTNVY